MVWALREYDEPDPIILSVGPEDEVAIGDVARSIARAMRMMHTRYMCVQFVLASAVRTALNGRRVLLVMQPRVEVVPVQRCWQRGVVAC